jgi:HAD superfamily hydrolase (TIGR01490 family)
VTVDKGSDRQAGEPGAEARGRPAVVAFFDLDGTLVGGQTTLLLVRFLRRVGVVKTTFLMGAALWFIAYKAGLVKITESSRSKSASVLTGLTPARVEELMKDFTEEVMMPRLHGPTSAALADHMARGNRAVVVSAALDPVVKALARRLRVTDYVGTSCEVDDGRYTGRLLDAIPYGDEKATLASGLMQQWGADPSACWAYADHDTDLALLRSVGHPVAVNPKPALLEVANRSGWPVL